MGDNFESFSESSVKNIKFLKKKRTRKIINKSKDKTHEDNKLKHVLGHGYTTLNCEQYAAKVHHVVHNCCKNECYKKLSSENLIDTFKAFMMVNQNHSKMLTWPGAWKNRQGLIEQPM